MPRENNPFKPSAPVHTGMFVGRYEELEQIERSLIHAKDGNPQHILIVGERGIGKTSLLLSAKYFSTDNSETTGHILNFLPIFLSINRKTTIRVFARNIQITLERELRKSQNKIQLLKDIWSFIKKVEVAGVRINDGTDIKEPDDFFENVVYSLLDTLKLIQKPDADYEKDGIILFIDELDNAQDNLELGIFFKQLTDKMAFEESTSILIIAAGLPKAIDVIKSSHESAIRIFNILPLEPLSESECCEVINRGLYEANKKNKKPVTIDDSSLKFLSKSSEGYPHFIQQMGYCAYDIDENDIIDVNDVGKAVVKAIDLIGERYYKEMYYGKVKEESYREILKLMSNKMDAWVSKDEIRKQYSRKETSLTNALVAMSKRNIILKNPEKNGEYKLQWKSFALWLKFITDKSIF